MATSASVYSALDEVGSRVQPGMSERDVENLFLETGFYRSLGYEGTGVDIRSEYTLPDDRRPDFVTLDSNEDVIAVYEFKTSGRDLPEHEDQLFHYMNELRSDYGVLTNGEELRVYQRGNTHPTRTLSTVSISKEQARELASALEKRELDFSKSEDVKRFREELDPIPLDERTDLGQENFFDTFRLEEGSPFANLVTGMMNLLHELRDEQETKFVKGAYDFWEATYADEPDEVPSSWNSFIDGRGSLRDFMFCLESGHALLSRLLLAKATGDHDFFEGTGYNGVDDYFDELRGFGETINLDAFPVAANNLIEDMQDRLVEGLFQDDIFIWWKDGYVEQLSRGHETRQNQFRSVAKGEGDIERVSEETRDRFSRAVAEVFGNILRFDFTDVQGDLLGNLYQRYFAPETRKALGEFYTPQPVVDYIMNGVGYDRGVSTERLIDPACGSGTFLVDAVERYLEDVERYATGEPDWESQLRELCTQPHIVGLDIHPFAVLMAQIRFVVAILPEYRKAKERNSEFTLRRLPIYRTNTLRNERELTGIDIGEEGSRQMTFNAMTESEQDVLIPVPLPVEVGEDANVETEDGFLVRRVRMPLFDTIQLETHVQSFGEYFAALQGVLDTVKDHMALAEEIGKEFDWTYQNGLEERVNEYTSQEYSGAEEFFEPYVNDMLENVRYLQQEHNDGRLFKMFEDTVLALVVKNYMEYDYVVGNPPYVRIQRITDTQQAYIDQLYRSTDGAYDLYYLFYERGLDMLNHGGKLGYITPSQFMMAEDGGKLRNVLRHQTKIKEIFDFRGAGVFEDALNYPAIVILQAGSGESDTDISCVRVRADYTEAPDDLGERVMSSATENRTRTRYTDSNVDVFQFPQSELTDGDWTLMPPEEFSVFRKLEKKADQRIEEITDAVFQGLRTGKNGVFIVEPLNVDRIPPEDGDREVLIQPTGSEQTFEIESDLLCPWLEQDSFRRWEANWDGKHLLIPYDSNDELISAETLSENFPLTWDYLNAHREKLESREGGDLEDSEDWYKLSRPQNLSRFQEPKLIGKEFSDSAQFIPDEGDWHFASAYGIALTNSNQTGTNFAAGYVNSNISEYYLKHISSIKSFSPVRAYYAYRTRYINQIPFKISNSDSVLESVRQIRKILEMDTKTGRFPEAYLGDYDSQLNYIEYEWQTRRYPVNAKVQADVEGEFVVQAGRSDTITHPAMYSDNREARKRRAEYVHAAVDGRNVRSGEDMTIPIPQDNSGVEKLLNQLEADRETVEETDIDKLEADINEAVYDLFDLTNDDREVIEDYLDVF